MSSHKLLYLILLCGLSPFAWGQRCGFTDTIAIGNQGITDLTVSIENYLNNDLGDSTQGLCGVSVYFQHSYVYDFTMTVTSPAGQFVQLVGPVNNQTRPPSNLARWFIDFNTCAEPPQPDGGAPGQWNNNNPFNWPAFGLSSGSYTPTTGCFEDLNSGVVNGDWTFSFNTERTGQQGRVTYILLEFCDDLNADGPCCFANAGELQPIPGLEFCEQSSNLPLGFTPRYRQPRPDAALYGYTFAIARNDSVLFTQDNINLGNLPAGGYEICGLSYRLGELDQLNLDGSLTFDDLRTDFEAVQPAFCGDLTPICQQVNLYPVPEPTFLDVQLCDGGVVRVGNTDYSTTGVRNIVLTGRAGCDSLVVLDLEIVQTLFETKDTTICAEAVYPQGDNLYDTPGTYIDTVISVLGCDSIVTLNLSFAPFILKDTMVAVCAGETFMIGAETFNATGNYVRTISSVNGCDSMVTLDLIVLDPEIVLVPVAPGLTCADPTILLDASQSTFEYTNRGVWTDINGTDLSFLRTFTADTAGLYIYELSNVTLGVGCTVKDSILINDFRFDIEADLALTQVQCDGLNEPCNFISCRNPTLGIRATPDSLGPAYDYTWTTPAGGNIIGSANGPEIIVDASGMYNLTIENPFSGCQLDTFFAIGIDTLAPRAVVSGNQLLNCDTTQILLAADTLQPNQQFLDYAWSGDCITGDFDGPVYVADCPGSYTLTVTNRRSGCSKDTTFIVVQDIAPSNLSLAPATAPLSCYFPERLLDASASASTNGQEFYWTYESAPDTIGMASTLTALLAGTYYLVAVDSVSRCFALDSIILLADILNPVARSGPDTLAVNCYTPEHLLGGGPTSIGPEFNYSWVRLSEPNDTLGRFSNFFVEDPGGLFEFTVIDTDNGCASTDRTRVLSRLDTPRIRIALPFDFDCFVDSVALDARTTNLNYESLQNWSGPCLAPARDTNLTWAYCPGTYFYTVINLETGCANRDSVTVELADNSVVALLPDSSFLNCETGLARLDRSSGTDAPVVRWFRNGMPVELIGLRPRVSLPGEYTLVLGNFNESCLDTARMIVSARCPALAIIVPPDSITCARPLVELDATVSFPVIGPSVITEWIIPPGATTQPGATERELAVFTPGTYAFVVNNLISGDTDTAFVEVIRNLVIPVSNAGVRDTVSCNFPLVTLNGTGSSEGALFDYVWTNTANDTLSQRLTADVTKGGVYLFRVTQRETGCSSIDNVRIISDLNVPDLNFTSDVIPCDTIDFKLAVIPDVQDNYTFAWSGPAIISEVDYDTIRIADPGVYTVEVINVRNGCSVVDSTISTRLPCPPFPRLVDTSLSCTFDTIFLETTFRDPCQGCTYTWRRNESVVLGETGTRLPVTEVGDYTIVVINQFGLQGEATATVTDSREVPENNAGPDWQLSCKVTNVLLWESAPEPDFPLVYRWISPDGTTIIGAIEDSLRVSTGGLFQLESTNTFSSCVVVDTVLVTYDTVAPIANAGPSRLLDCDNKRQVLDGINSSLGQRYVYRWSGGPSVACLEGETVLNPLIRCGGDYQLMVTDTVNGCRSVSSARVNVDEALPVVIPYPDTSINCGRDTLLLFGQDISRPNINYGWEEVLPPGNESLPEVSPGVLEVTSSGTFRFYIQDTLNGCENDFTVNVTADLNVPVVMTSAADTFFCELSSLLVIGTADLINGRNPILSWTSRTGFFIGDANSSVATIFQPDMYLFTATDPENLCSATDSVLILRDVEAPVVAAGNDTSLTCSLTEVELFGQSITISGQSNYGWTTMEGLIVSGAMSQTPVVAATGRYLLTVTDPVSGCTGADILRVRADTLRPVANVFFPQGTRLDCNRRELRLDGRVNQSQGLVNFLWSGPDDVTLEPQPNPDDLSVISSGVYRLLVTRRRNDCRDTLITVITEDFVPPAPVINPPLEFTCLRDSFSLVIDPVSTDINYRYQWRNETDSLLGRGPAQFIFSEGEYTLITVDQSNGCRDTTFTLAGSDLALPLVTLATPSVLNCDRIVATIDGRGSSNGQRFNVAWASPGNTVVASDDPYRVRGREPGSYFLTVTDQVNGCFTMDSVELMREAIQIAGFSLAVDQPACEQDRDGMVEITVIEGGTAPFRYRLDNGLLTGRTAYDGLPTGRYDLEVVGADGCSSMETFEILMGPEPRVNLREDTTIRLGDSIDLDFLTTFQNWDTLNWTSSGPLPELQSDSTIRVSPFESQTYRLQILDEEGCSATDFVVITVDGQVNVYVPMAFSPNGDNNNDFFRPYAGTQVQNLLTFKVYDRWGELLYDLNTDPLRDSDSFGWDGRLGGLVMNSQILIWELEVELVDGTVLRKFGDFVLMR
jgi:gliding motility-associated-like protein